MATPEPGVRPGQEPADPPGTSALSASSAALVGAIVLAVVAFALASIGLLPALGLLLIAIPLGIYGRGKAQRRAPQIRRDAGVGG